MAPPTATEHRGAREKPSTARHARRGATPREAGFGGGAALLRGRRGAATQHLEELLAVALELRLPDAADPQQRIAVRGPLREHLLQRRVVEDHVRRQVALARDLAPTLAQRFPKIAIGIGNLARHGGRSRLAPRRE